MSGEWLGIGGEEGGRVSEKGGRGRRGLKQVGKTRARKEERVPEGQGVAARRPSDAIICHQLLSCPP